MNDFKLSKIVDKRPNYYPPGHPGRPSALWEISDVPGLCVAEGHRVQSKMSHVAKAKGWRFMPGEHLWMMVDIVAFEMHLKTQNCDQEVNALHHDQLVKDGRKYFDANPPRYNQLLETFSSTLAGDPGEYADFISGGSRSEYYRQAYEVWCVLKGQLFHTRREALQALEVVMLMEDDDE